MDLFSFISAQGLRRPSKNIALDLIYAATDMQYPADKIVLGEPQEVDPRLDLQTDPNTFVPVLSVSQGIDARFNTDAEDGFLYRRIPLSWLTPLEAFGLEQPDEVPFNVHQFLDGLSEKLGVQFSKEDILNETYENPQFSIIVRAAPTSLVWVGEIEIVFDGLTLGRLSEDGSVRITEDGFIRIPESE